MARIEESIEIAASPTDVFRFCHEPEKRPDWDVRVTRVELLTPQPVRQGTLVRVDAGRAGEALFSWDGEYLSHQYPISSTVKVLDAAPSSPFKSGSETWQFSAMGGGTRMTVTWEYTPRGIIARIGDALGGRASTRRAIRHSLANLKGLIEGR
jgi:uncharacterized protein YndB with AHSA1/START domain